MNFVFKNLATIVLPAIIISCNMKTAPLPINIKEYSELGSIDNSGKEYVVEEIINKKYEIGYTFFDKIENRIITDAYYKQDDIHDYSSKKIALDGKILSECNINNILADGTMWDRHYFQNWIIDDDTTKHTYLDPLTDEERRKPKKWLEKFEQMYDMATVVYEKGWSYYMKIEGLWYKFGQNLEVNSQEFERQYPIKFDTVRMQKLETNISPSFGVAPEKRDTSLLVERLYISEMFEKSERGSGFSFSAGWWYFDLFLPNGDTLKFKRYASIRNPDLKIFQIPEEHGGRKDVYYIIQEADEMLKEQSGGMFIIKPANMER